MWLLTVLVKSLRKILRKRQGFLFHISITLDNKDCHKICCFIVYSKTAKTGKATFEVQKKLFYDFSLFLSGQIHPNFAE